MAAGPLISVVVSTFNRPARLERLLDALRAQTLGARRFEVIVVDNGSQPATGGVLDGELEVGRLALRRVRHEVTLGPAGGRNAGWRLARAPLVAFTDDDCRPEPSWLEAMVAACAEHPGAVVQGPTRPDPAERDREGWLSHTVRIERLGPQYETCNIAYPRATLARLDGFDESFGLRPAGEDTDLAWRAIESGTPTAFAPEAAVLHAVERVGARGRLALAARWGPVVRVLAAHPGSRAMLYRGRFWNVWHYLLWRSLLAAAGPAWLRRLVLARHLMTLRERARREGASSVAIPFLLMHDAVECAAIARGAIRYRTLVL
ncbi:MAG TPA: glycosyltransferase [Solirubrobacteraceae bacterium]|jgi:glycosyltransferase involved in cell wall biosynthesis|nr:glycosyltransferase [Solirubrobacteraceae bacterium]